MFWHVFEPHVAHRKTEAHRSVAGMRGEKRGGVRLSHTGSAPGPGRFWVSIVGGPGGGAGPGRGFQALGPSIKTCRGSARPGAAIWGRVGVGVVGCCRVWRPQRGHPGLSPETRLGPGASGCVTPASLPGRSR